MKRPHFDVQLHQDELGRPQSLQDQNRDQTNQTSVDRTLSESGINEKPQSGVIRFLSWLFVIVLFVGFFLWWLFN